MGMGMIFVSGDRYGIAKPVPTPLSSLFASISPICRSSPYSTPKEGKHHE